MTAMPHLSASFIERLHAATLKTEAKAHGDTSSERAHEQYAALDSDDARAFVDRYLRAGIEAEAEEFMRTAEPGNRNDPLLKAACSIFEMANSSPTFDGDEFEERLIEMGEASGHDPESVRKTVASARRRTDGKGRDVDAIAAKRAGDSAPAVSAEIPECPPDPSSSTRVLVHTKSGRSLSAVTGAIKKKMTPAAQDVFFGRATATTESSAQLLTDLAVAARSVPGASPELVQGIVLVSEDEKTTRVFAEDRHLWPSIWAKWHAAPTATPEQRVDRDGPPPLLGIDDDEPLLIVHDSSNYLRLKSGGYDYLGVGNNGLVPRIQSKWIARAEEFKIDYQDQKGNWRKRTPTWVQTHVWTEHVRTVTYAVGEGSQVINLGTEKAELRQSVAPVNIDLPGLTRDELREQEQCDLAIVGPRRVEVFRDYLAVMGRESSLLQLGHLNGQHSTGKGFTIGGFHDLFGGASGPDVLLSPFNESLLLYSLICLEEGLYCDPRYIPTLVKLVRGYVTGDVHTITRKNQSTVLLRRNLRLIISENGDEALRLVLGRDGSSQDASIVRVLSFKTLDTARAWFNDRGNFEWSRKPGAEQIGGDPHKGGMKRARYYAQLARERKLVNVASDGKSGRFVIHDPDEVITSTEGTDVRMLHERAMAVLEIVATTTSIGNASSSAILVEHEGDLYVSAAALTAMVRERRIACTASQVANDLRLLAPTGIDANEDTRRSWTQPEKRRLHRLDARRIVAVAEEQQLDISFQIRRLAEARTTK